MYIINSRLGFDHILGFWVLFFSLNYTLMYCKHYAAYCILTSFYILQYTHIHIVLFSYAIYCDAFVRFSLLELLYFTLNASARWDRALALNDRHSYMIMMAVILLLGLSSHSVFPDVRVFTASCIDTLLCT